MHTHTCIFIIYICAHMYVCMYVCICVRVCYSLHVYVHTYIPGPCYDSSTILPITLVHKGQVCICSNANRQSVIIEAILIIHSNSSYVVILTKRVPTSRRNSGLLTAYGQTREPLKSIAEPRPLGLTLNYQSLLFCRVPHENLQKGRLW